MSTEGRLKVYTGQRVCFCIAKDADNEQIGRVVVTCVGRSGMFYSHPRILPTEDVWRVIRPFLGEQVGLLVWEGTVYLGSISGFDLKGELRKASPEEIARFMSTGRM